MFSGGTTSDAATLVISPVFLDNKLESEIKKIELQIQKGNSKFSDKINGKKKKLYLGCGDPLMGFCPYFLQE